MGSMAETSVMVHKCLSKGEREGAQIPTTDERRPTVGADVTDRAPSLEGTRSGAASYRRVSVLAVAGCNHFFSAAISAATSIGLVR